MARSSDRGSTPLASTTDTPNRNIEFIPVILTGLRYYDNLINELLKDLLTLFVVIGKKQVFFVVHDLHDRFLIQFLCGV
ncbi:hypothetical protein [Collibacillus ludicampi]|uniref:hypothetical protein n=1 Tax=Collibacillus ludicampi TaxID=2771369 RepID=UPI00249484B5|nr:hypothetical protein [Collibacillus ludicampi]